MAKPVKTIGNPATWLFNTVGGASRFAKDATLELGSGAATKPEVIAIDFDDLREALRKGAEDFSALRTDVMFMVLLYPIIGLCLAAFAFRGELLPLLFPLMSGFALLGPIAAIGLYEMSKKRERGEPAGFQAALGVLGSPSIGAIFAIGVLLLAIFVMWMFAAYLIFAWTLGPAAPVSAGAFLSDVFTTGPGWLMIIIGCGVGFLFAAVTLAVSIVSIPLILDRHVGVPIALITSLELTRKNPMIVAAWGLIVVGCLILGMLPLLLGLVIAFPILGHATWHLYRLTVR